MRRPAALAALALLFFSWGISAQTPASPSVLPGNAPIGFPETPLDELLVHQWLYEDGLPSESLTDIVQTGDGYLWMSTYQGLIRFDGRRFVQLGKKEIDDRLEEGSAELVSEGFGSLTKSPSGELWSGNEAGQIVHHVKGKFEVFETPISGSVESLFFDSTAQSSAQPTAQLWVAAKTLAVGDSAASLTLIETLGSQGRSLKSLTRYQDSLWMGSAESGLLELQADGTLVVHGPSENPVRALTRGCDEALWIGHWNGLSRRKAGQIEEIPEFDGVIINQMSVDRSCRLWLATNQGLGRRHPDGSVEWLRDEQKGLMELAALCFDREGNLWLAGRSGGLFRLKKVALRGIGRAQGMPAGRVEEVLELHDGKVLAAVGTAQAVEIVEDRVVRILPLPEFSTKRAAVLYEDSQRNLWIGSYQGLLKIGPQGRELFSQETGFPSSQIRALQEDRSGSLWVGTGNHGLVEIRSDGTQHLLGENSGLISNFIFSLRADPEGRLLVGLREGFHRISPQGGKIETWRSGSDFPGGAVFHLTPDSVGGLWLSTDAGPTYFDGENFSVFHQEQGLPVQKIYDLQEDSLGNVWMGTSEGILRAKRSLLLEAPPDAGLPNESNLPGAPEFSRVASQMVLFGTEDGMTHRQMTGPQHITKMSDGRLWFPTHEGITVVTPGEEFRNEVAPLLAIERFLVDEVAVKLGPSVSLPPESSQLLFEFAVLSFRNPSENRIRYRLTGFDERWKDAGDQRMANYTNLPHGHYAFEVIGANDDGKWNMEGARQEFEIRPALYEMLPFRIAAIFLCGVLLYGFYRWRLRAYRARERALAATAEERRRLVVELQARNQEIDRYLYLFSHDLKNPLVTIRSFADLTEQDMDKQQIQRAKKDLSRVRDAADHMNRQLDNLLMLAEIGRFKTKKQSCDLGELVHEAIARCSESIAERGAHVEILGELPKVYAQRNRLIEVIEELLNNALRYSKETPTIQMGADREKTVVRFWIRDQGQGIDSSYHQKVFQLLYQLDPKNDGMGIGLTLVQRVIEEHDGKIGIESDGKNAGTMIWFTLPLRPRKKS